MRGRPWGHVCIGKSLRARPQRYQTPMLATKYSFYSNLLRHPRSTRYQDFALVENQDFRSQHYVYIYCTFHLKYLLMQKRRSSFRHEVEQSQGASAIDNTVLSNVIDADKARVRRELSRLRWWMNTLSAGRSICKANICEHAATSCQKLFNFD